MTHDASSPTVDRSILTVASLKDADRDEMAYWHSKTPLERLAALELNRRIIYGDPPTGFQRVLEIVERKRR